MTKEEILELWRKGYSKKYIVNLVLYDINQEFYESHIYIKKEPKTLRREAQKIVEDVVYEDYMRKLRKKV